MRTDDLIRPARALLAAAETDDLDRMDHMIMWLRCAVLDHDLAEARSLLSFNEHTIQNLQETIDTQAQALVRGEIATRELRDTVSRYERPLELAAELLGVGPLDQVPDAIRALQRQLPSFQEAPPIAVPEITPDPLLGVSAWLGGLKPMNGERSTSDGAVTVRKIQVDEATAPRPKKLITCPWCLGEEAPQHPSRCPQNPNRIVSGIARKNGHAAEPLAEVAADADPT